MKNWEIVIITGMSGAGKTLTIDFFEDHGFFCIDNLPAPLLHSFIMLYQKSRIKEKKLAFIIDIRSFTSPEEFISEVEKIRHPKIQVTLLFLECKIEELIKRYTLTRRTHPIKEEENLLGKIELEKKRLTPIKNIADIVIDTSGLKPKEFIQNLYSHFKSEEEVKLHITFTSFGFKNGIPLDLDMMFDVRSLPNPYYDAELKLKTGINSDVRNFVLSSLDSQELLKRIIWLLEFNFPLMEREGKAYINVGIGCSGGRHRSVTFVHELKEYFTMHSKYTIKSLNRDIEKE
ncbi:MAG: RNase adapter RapZ [Fusobacteria bacterium]|nr:RNase adapter RapZ [Fusobacteriota bacterium]